MKPLPHVLEPAWCLHLGLTFCVNEARSHVNVTTKSHAGTSMSIFIIASIMAIYSRSNAVNSHAETTKNRPATPSASRSMTASLL